MVYVGAKLVWTPDIHPLPTSQSNRTQIFEETAGLNNTTVWNPRHCTANSITIQKIHLQQSLHNFFIVRPCNSLVQSLASGVIAQGHICLQLKKPFHCFRVTPSSCSMKWGAFFNAMRFVARHTMPRNKQLKNISAAIAGCKICKKTVPAQEKAIRKNMKMLGYLDKCSLPALRPKIPRHKNPHEHHGKTTDPFGCTSSDSGDCL